MSIFNLRYGHYLSEQVLATLGVNRTNFDGGGADSTTLGVTGGVKYYFGLPGSRGSLLPFVEAAIGFANVDTMGNDSTDLTWEIGGGAAYFLTEATSFDLDRGQTPISGEPFRSGRRGRRWCSSWCGPGRTGRAPGCRRAAAARRSRR
ncbi:MAG: outer membrane beta-barrel protein [Betaproteobacteria bacterium]